MQIYKIAWQAFSAPTTAKHITGDTAYVTVTNFAMDIFSSSSAPLTSAREVSLVAGGPGL
jgi:hypothetical protein